MSKRTNVNDYFSSRNYYQSGGGRHWLMKPTCDCAIRVLKDNIPTNKYHKCGLKTEEKDCGEFENRQNFCRCSRHQTNPCLPLLSHDYVPFDKVKKSTMQRPLGEKKEMNTLSVLTLNVQMYKTCKGHNNCQTIVPILQQYRPDVICVQEDLWVMDEPDRPAHPFIGYTMVAECEAEQFLTKKTATRTIIEQLFNKIYVRDDLVNFCQAPKGGHEITSGCPVPRCASFITIKSITIANLHVCGGQFDDKMYGRLEDVKYNHITSIVDFLQKNHNKMPDLIVGDFNGEDNFDLAVQSLAKHPLYAQLSNDEKKKFMNFYMGHKRALDEYGYQVAYDHSIGPTSRFNTTIDWMYYQNQKLRPIKPSIVLPTIKMDYTDHNGVLMTFQIL